MSGLENLEQWREKQHNKSIIAYTDHPKTCKHCGKEIPYEKRANDYCNSSCFASENNKGVCRNKEYYQRLYPNKIEKIDPCVIKHSNTCKYCGSVISTRKQYCNTRCLRMFATEQKIKHGRITHANKRAVKMYLIDTRGHKCEQCENTIWLNHKIPLDIHHKDGDVTNMALENLKLLCPNCHTLTDNYKSKNRSGKHNRQTYKKQ